ncbi:hypothetical protein AAF712_004658 [Marasmius tenuissimus]|uniref:Uncharacterized protein n=1 Tax=Marasmius tenuissimus TaxID=585030 RepID=A0ABR3A2Q6_9AGAR|nr:hypothetical protein PM082_021416 [Marasmius tenuissimus]
MSSNHGHGAYDQSLLAAAPETTKQMRQEGYNPDILSAPKTSNASNTNLNRDLESGITASKERLGPNSATPIPPRRVPFYRTTKGMVIIGIAALVVIGAIVGGAVGGTRKKKNEDGDSSDAPGSGGQQVGSTDAPGGGVAPLSSSQAANPLSSALSQALSSGAPTTTAGQPVQSNPAGPPGQGQRSGTSGQGVGQHTNSNVVLNGIGKAIGSELVVSQ